MTTAERERFIEKMVEELLAQGLSRAEAEARVRKVIVHELDVIEVDLPPAAKPRRAK